MANKEIRELLKKNKIFLWQLALKIGKCEQTLVRWLRTPLTQEQEQIILKAITEIIAERKNKNE